MFIRRVLSGVLALGLAIGASACSSDGGSPSDTNGKTEQTAAAGESTTFTHPQIEGLTIEFDKKPERVVADFYSAAVLLSYGVKPVGVWGFGYESPDIKEALEGQDIPVIGKEGEIDVEKLADLQPDVIMGHGSKDGWSWFEDDVNAQLKQIAPFIPLATKGGVDENIDANLKIAQFLGADANDPNIAKAKEEYEAGKQAFKDAVAGKDLVIMLGVPSQEVYYTAMGFPQNALVDSLGVQTVGAPKPEQGNPWGKLDWESFPGFKADVVGVTSVEFPNDMSNNELWKAHPAVKANQILEWDQKLSYTYHAYAGWLNKAAETLKGYNKLQ